MNSSNKTFGSVVGAVGVALMMAGSAQATKLYYEGFDYNPGLVSAASLQPNASGNSTAWFETRTNTPTFNTGSLTYSGVTNTGNRLVQNDPPGTVGALSFPFTWNDNVTANAMFSTAGTYYITILGKVTPASDVAGDDGIAAVTFYSRPAINQGYIQVDVYANGGGELTFDMEVDGPGAGSYNSGITPAITYAGTYLLALRVINDGGTGPDDVRLVRNPTLGGEPDWSTPLFMSTASDITSAASTFSTIILGRAQEWDEIRIATTWAEAVSVVPEPSSMALLGLGGLFLLRRCRRG